jgi:hypothetical protein
MANACPGAAIIVDAMVVAGCTNKDIMAHCRFCGEHVRGGGLNARQAMTSGSLGPAAVSAPSP